MPETRSTAPAAANAPAHAAPAAAPADAAPATGLAQLAIFDSTLLDGLPDAAAVRQPS